MTTKPLDMAKTLGVSDMKSHINKLNQELNSLASAVDGPLKESIYRLAQAPSKRLRSSLVIATATAANKPIDQRVIDCCVAVELVHLGSLVHDDIIDNADTRWGLKTINSTDGNAQAIVIGDYLLAKACQRVAIISPEIAELIAKTITELCTGESYEISERYNTGRSIESLVRAIDGKTAALISGACRLGGLCAGLKADKISALGDYGRNLGVAFQLIDDLADLVSTNQLMGKPVGRDAEDGIYTMPLLLGLSGPNSKKLKIMLKRSQLENDRLVEHLLDDGSIQKTVAEIKNYNDHASKALEGFGNDLALEELKNFPDAYLVWFIDNLVVAKYRKRLAQK